MGVESSPRPGWRTGRFVAPCQKHRKAAPAQHGGKTPKNEHREPRQRERNPGSLEGSVPVPATPGLQTPRQLDERKPGLRHPTESQYGEWIYSTLFSSSQNEEHGERLAGHRMNAAAPLSLWVDPYRAEENSSCPRSGDVSVAQAPERPRAALTRHRTPALSPVTPTANADPRSQRVRLCAHSPGSTAQARLAIIHRGKVRAIRGVPACPRAEVGGPAGPCSVQHLCRCSCSPEMAGSRVWWSNLTSRHAANHPYLFQHLANHPQNAVQGKGRTNAAHCKV